MAQPSKHKPPLDVLQSMINGILIEIGKALGSNDKETGRTLASGSTRLQTTIPSAADNFHQALDELEIDILRAKAVLQRDLEEKRAERLAREAPAPVPQPQPEEPKEESPIELSSPEKPTKDVPSPSDLLANIKTSPAAQPSLDLTSNTEPAPIPTAQMIIADASEMQKSDSQQSASQIANPQPSKTIGLGITTDTQQDTPQDEAQDMPPTTAEAPPSAIDSLFDIPDTATGNDDTFNFDDMDFSVDATNNQDQAQTQNTEFDLSTFGNETQDFNMLDIPVTNDSASNNLPTTKADDIFADLGASADGGMDLDLENMDMGEGNTFDDLFLAGGDDDLNTGGGDMEHGDFDREFFGLE